LVNIVIYESSPPINKKADEARWRSRAPKSIRIQLETPGVSRVEGEGEVLLQLQTGGGFVGGVTGGDNNTDTLNTHTHWHSYGDAWSDLFSGDIDPKLESARDQVRAFYLRRHSPLHS
jgi:hypothetical protein